MDPEQIQRIQQAMVDLQRGESAAIAQILNRKQMERLEQIRLRIIGPTAVAEEKVAQALMMAPEQFQQVQGIMADYDAQAGSMMRRNFEAMRPPGGPGGEGFPGGGGGARGNAGPGEGAPGGNRPVAGGQLRPNPPGDSDDQNQRDRRREFMNSPQFREMQDRIARMAEEEEQLLKRAEAAIAKVLTSRQKQQFNRMLGEDFDLTKLVQGPPQEVVDGERVGISRERGGNGSPVAGTPANNPAPATVAPGEGSAGTPTARGGRTRIPPRVRGYSNDEGR